MEFDFAKHSLDPDQLVTRKGMVALSERIIGVKVSIHTINKRPPSADAIIGKRECYRVRKAVDYLMAQIRPVAAEPAE